MAEYGSWSTPTEVTPEERQRRLGQVYGLLIALARRKRAEQQQLAKPVQATNSSASMAN